MATNPYFSPYTYTGEQNLYEGMIAEAIQIHGIDIKYMPRQLVDGGDYLWGEDPNSYFDKSMTIEAYVNEVEGYGALQDMMGPAGFESAAELSVIISKKRWKEEAAIELTASDSVPKEGSIIYIPYLNRVFQIERVKDQVGFSNFGKKYVYDLTVSSFKYSHQKMTTGVSAVDNLMSKFDIDLDGNISPEESIKMSDSDNAKIQEEADTVVDFESDDPFAENGRY
jgi:hypothetical protein